MRRGLTPVISIILLILMAVAAVGGAYLWYGRFQSGTQERVSREMSDRVEGEMGTAISISTVYATQQGASGPGNSTITPINEYVDDDFNYFCSKNWLESDYNNNTLKSRGTIDCNETSAADAKLVVMIKNTGSEIIKASAIPAGNNLGETKVLIDGRPMTIHIDNGTMSTYNYFEPKSLKVGETRRIDVDFSCRQIGQKASGKITLEVIPKQGSSDHTEVTCDECCLSLLVGQAECERESCA